MDSGVFTFVFGLGEPDQGDAILSPAERRHRIAGLGLDWYYCPDYDSFCDLTPEQFVDEVLIGRMNAAAVFCGDNFTFGQGGAGNVPLLAPALRRAGDHRHGGADGAVGGPAGLLDPDPGAAARGAGRAGERDARRALRTGGARSPTASRSAGQSWAFRPSTSGMRPGCCCPQRGLPHAGGGRRQAVSRGNRPRRPADG